MLLTLLLDPHWTGMGQILSFIGLSPFVLALIGWSLHRGVPLVKSPGKFDRRNGWLCFVLAAAIAIAFYLLTLGNI
jgi:hypothetical protein